MRKKVHFLSILFTVGLMLSVFTNKVWGERLVKYLSAEDGTIFYYDIDSMKKSSGKIKVWETIKYSDDSEIKNRMIKLRKDIKKCNGCEKLSESKILYEINSDLAHLT